MTSCRCEMLFVALGLILASAPVRSRAQEAAPDDTLARLVNVYATQPQGYPTAPEFARPDTSVPFRWHFFHDGAIPFGEAARAVPHIDAYNLLEDDLLEEAPAGQWPIENLSQRQLGLQDGDIVAVTGGAVLAA